MSADETPADATARRARDDAGLSVLGRLLWVGVVAGLLLGGLVAALVSGEVDLFSIGAMVGALAGVTVQALTSGVLFAARRALGGLSAPQTRALLVPLPAAGALVAPVIFSASYTAAGWLVVIGGAAAAALVAWLAAPWCVAPITVAGPVPAT